MAGIAEASGTIDWMQWFRYGLSLTLFIFFVSRVTYLLVLLHRLKKKEY